MSASLTSWGSEAVVAVEPVEVLCVLAVAAPPAARTKAPAARAAGVRVRIVIDCSVHGLWNWPPMAGNVVRWHPTRAMSRDQKFAASGSVSTTHRQLT